MDIKQKITDIGQKVTHLDWKRLIGTKAFITVGCVVLVCIAVLVSSLLNNGQDMTVGGETSENRVLGNTILVDASVSDKTDNSDTTDGNTSSDTETNADGESDEDFFAMAILNRTQVRDSALEVLREIADNPDTLPDAKEEALSSIAAIADDMSAEANIETLIEAKGISQCVAVISGDSCSIIVNTKGLVSEELTQITDIVYEQTGIPVANITVVEAQQ